jgi:iron complex transport system ATP-binding protein
MESFNTAHVSVPRLQLEKLTIGFKHKTVLTNIQFTIAPGELIALAGPNGGGKTTLLKTIGGLLKPKAGSILLDGKDIASMKKREKAGKISFLFQGTASDWHFTVAEIVAQGRFPYQGLFGSNAVSDRLAIARAIKAAGLSGFENRPVTELSGGEFQRVLIARAMAQEAQLLLLDEPANNLDPKYQYMVMNLVRAMTDTGQAALVSIHDLNLASLYADRIILISNRSIAAIGKPADVLREDILYEAFGIPLVISPHAQAPHIQGVSFPLPKQNVLEN